MSVTLTDEQAAEMERLAQEQANQGWLRGNLAGKDANVYQERARLLRAMVAALTRAPEAAPRCPELSEFGRVLEAGGSLADAYRAVGVEWPVPKSLPYPDIHTAVSPEAIDAQIDAMDDAEEWRPIPLDGGERVNPLERVASGCGCREALAAILDAQAMPCFCSETKAPCSNCELAIEAAEALAACPAQPKDEAGEWEFVSQTSYCNLPDDVTDYLGMRDGDLVRVYRRRAQREGGDPDVR